MYMCSHVIVKLSQVYPVMVPTQRLEVMHKFNSGIVLKMLRQGGRARVCTLLSTVLYVSEGTCTYISTV